MRMRCFCEGLPACERDFCAIVSRLVGPDDTWRKGCALATKDNQKRLQLLLSIDAALSRMAQLKQLLATIEPRRHEYKRA